MSKGISRWQIVMDSSNGGERRFFALLELICFPLSLLTLFGVLPFRIIAGYCGMEIPIIWNHVMDVLLTAAVGYVTNFLALEMLFKPYTRNGKHILSILTLGYWRQGLVPKNKDRIGAEMGRQVETRLLKPEQLADELCGMVTSMTEDKQVVTCLRKGALRMLIGHEQKIMDVLVPLLENAMASGMETLLTKERLAESWEKDITPIVNTAENRRMMARQIVDGVRRHSPQVVEMMKSEMRDVIRGYLRNSSFGAFLPSSLADNLVEMVDWNHVEERLCRKLVEGEVPQMIESELERGWGLFGDWLKSEESHEKVEAWIIAARRRLKAMIHVYLERAVPGMIEEVKSSESIWRWVEETLLPSLRPELEEWVRREGKDQVLKKLNLSERIRSAVEQQDVREFHDMITSVSAQHLGAIQVLGYLLGGLVGIAQAFV